MGNIWTVHQILKPIIGPSSSHTSAALIAGYLTYRLSFLDELFPEINEENFKDSLRYIAISFSCENPSVEEQAFIGHRSIRALFIGLMGGYLDEEGRKNLEKARKILDNYEENSLKDLTRVSFNPVRLPKGSAYGVSLHTVRKYKNVSYMLNINSLGGGIIRVIDTIASLPSGESIDFIERPDRVPDSDELVRDIRELFSSDVPIWVYFDSPSLFRFRNYHSFRPDIVEQRTDFYTMLDKTLEKHPEEKNLETMMVGELIHNLEEKHITATSNMMKVVANLMWENNEKQVTSFRYSKYAKEEFAFYRPRHKSIFGKLINYTLNTQILNAEMEVVVSAPTGGASGVLPANLRVFAEENKIKKSSKEFLYAHYTAAAIGAFIANNMSVSGSQHGCLAEIGASVAMAAGALIDLMLDRNINLKKRAKMIFDGVAVALLGLQGLACDPLFGYVEVPCILRNAILSALPMQIAELLVSGYIPIMTLRCTIEAMKKTGEILTKALRESGTGPITCAYALCKLAEKGIEGEIISLFDRKIDWAK